MTSADLENRAKQFAELTGATIEARLGFGSDGTVWQTDRKTAIKVFERREVYEHELAVYQRLADREVVPPPVEMREAAPGMC